MEAEIISALIAAVIPSLTTLITYIWTSRASCRRAAKQSILQMIMEDKIAWIIDHEFPTNYGRIVDEYKIYHDNGGNGEVAKKVDEYKNWYVFVEESLKK